MKRTIFAIAPLGVLGGAMMLAPSATADAQRPAAFAPCAACHATEAGKTSFGPNLRGVVGRKAASLPGYAYSPALKATGLTWDRAQLDEWLTSPQKKVPGTKMPFAGLSDPGKRQEVIDYLASLK